MMRSHFKGKLPLEKNKDLVIDRSTGLILGAKYVPSPNFDLRTNENEINLIVIHGISLPPKEFSDRSEDYIINFFTNKLDPEIHPYFKEIVHLKVSSHCLITRKGKLIQFVPFKYRAWHAGKSSFNGIENCNDFSIGIELEGSDQIPYTPKQYKILKVLINALKKHYPLITSENIVGHCHIAPDRKTDPGPAFDWDLIKNFE